MMLFVSHARCYVSYIIYISYTRNVCCYSNRLKGFDKPSSGKQRCTLVQWCILDCTIAGVTFACWSVCTWACCTIWHYCVWYKSWASFGPWLWCFTSGAACFCCVWSVSCIWTAVFDVLSVVVASACMYSTRMYSHWLVECEHCICMYVLWRLVCRDRHSSNLSTVPWQRRTGTRLVHVSLCLSLLLHVHRNSK